MSKLVFVSVQMVSALAMFLSPEERRCCRYVSGDNPLPYHPDVCVQGILQVGNSSLIYHGTVLLFAFLTALGTQVP